MYMCCIFKNQREFFITLENLNYYKTDFRWFIYLNFFIESGLILD